MPSTLSRKASKLLTTEWYEHKDDLEEKLESGFNVVQARISNSSEREAYDGLLQLISEQKHPVEHVVGGLLYGLLTEPQNGFKYFSMLSMVTNDGWFCTLCTVNMVLFEMYPKLKPEIREQIFFFFREAIKSNVPKIDNVLINLIRNSNDGSDFKDSCTLISAVVHILCSNYSWLGGLKPKASLIPVALQTFSRFIRELKAHQQCESLYNQLIIICVWLLKERFSDCMQLGRDLVLILMNFSKISEFNLIWKSLLQTPSNLAPNFSGLEELMSRPCPYNLPTYRISVTMQRKMDFILTRLKPGLQEKHFEWLKKRHLSSADAGTLRADFIRCALFASWNDAPHGHDMRALLISNLFSQFSKTAELQWCKLLFFWDWFCFDSSAGGHALIESGFATLRSLFHLQPPIANSLMDFLTRMTCELIPHLQSRVIASVTNAFKVIGDNHAFGPIASVIDHSFLQRNIREAFKDVFKNLCRQPAQTASTPFIISKNDEIAVEAEVITDAESVDIEPENSVVTYEKPMECSTLKIVPIQPQITISDDVCDSVDDVENDHHEKMASLLAEIKDEVRESISNFSSISRSNNDSRCEMMQNVLTNLIDYDDLLDDDQIDLIGECLLTILANDIRSRKLMPEDSSLWPETVQEILNQPLIVLFRMFCFTPVDKTSRQPLLSLITEMFEKCNSISYFLLLFVCCGHGDQSESNISAYTDLCHHVNRTVMDKIVYDLEHCHIYDHNLFAYLIIQVYEKFANIAIGNAELIKLLVYSVDAHQVCGLIGEMICENISFFRKDTFFSLLVSSLKWETIPQFMLWQIILAENVPFEWILPIIPKLQHPLHSEAITHVYILLQRMDQQPSMNLIRTILSRSVVDDFAINCLKIIISTPAYAGRVADLLASLIDKLIQSNDLTLSQAKGKRHYQRYVCLDQLFAYLDKFRRSCLSKISRSAELFLASPVLQRAFTSARAAEKVSSLRIRYSELFAVMEILSDDVAQTSRLLRRPKATRRATESIEDDCKVKRKRQSSNAYSDSE